MRIINWATILMVIWGASFLFKSDKKEAPRIFVENIETSTKLNRHNSEVSGAKDSSEVKPEILEKDNTVDEPPGMPSSRGEFKNSDTSQVESESTLAFSPYKVTITDMENLCWTPITSEDKSNGWDTSWRPRNSHFKRCI